MLLEQVNFALAQHLSSQPVADTPDSLVHLGSGSRVAETQEMFSVHRVEVDARRCGNARLVKHAFCEIQAVGGETRNIRVEIERSIDRQKAYRVQLSADRP